MEGAGKLIDDDELREAMQEKGLGTPATRAAIIEGLIYEKYIHREGRELVPGAKAFQLMTLLRGLGVEDLTKPELTGNWEYQLAEMEKGHLERETFMKQIAEMAERIVKKAKEYDRDTIPGDYATLATPCPNCGGVVKENYRRYACIGVPGEREGCGFSISKIPGGRAFELAEVEAFLRDKRIGPLEGFRSKAGWPFTAELKLVHDDEIEQLEARVRLRRGRAGARASRASRSTSATRRASAKCPKTQGKVYEFGTNYVCEHSVGPAPSCDFKSGKVILQQPVAREQMTKLLTTGATDLLDGFVSNKTRRKFKARLAWDAKENKVVFAFEPRPERRPAAKKFAGAGAAKPWRRRRDRRRSSGAEEQERDGETAKTAKTRAVARGRGGRTPAEENARQRRRRRRRRRRRSLPRRSRPPTTRPIAGANSRPAQQGEARFLRRGVPSGTLLSPRARRPSWIDRLPFAAPSLSAALVAVRSLAEAQTPKPPPRLPPNAAEASRIPAASTPARPVHQRFAALGTPVPPTVGGPHRDPNRSAAARAAAAEERGERRRLHASRPSDGATGATRASAGPQGAYGMKPAPPARQRRRRSRPARRASTVSATREDIRAPARGRACCRKRRASAPVVTRSTGAGHEQHSR